MHDASKENDERKSTKKQRNRYCNSCNWWKFNVERRRERKNDMNLKIAKDEIIIDFEIANEKNATITDFEIKICIVVVVCDATFDDEIIDDEIETKTKEDKIETNVENFVDRDFDQLHQNQIWNVCTTYVVKQKII